MAKITELFYSIQGEIDIGKPAVFVRFSGCNLIGSGRGCKWCDTKYAEGEWIETTANEIAKKIMLISSLSPQLSDDCRNVVVTGGEPLLQYKEVFELMEILWSRDMRFEFDLETNGTIYCPGLLSFHHINCSPKGQAYNLDVIEKVCSLPGSRFKFVYEHGEDKWWENIVSAISIPPSKVWIMPQGCSREEQLSLSEEVINYCKEEGFNFTPRFHIILWENLRER